MENSKRLIVLSGSGHKGILKLTAGAGSAKGSCSLDFRPAGANLYIIGDDIAQIALKDINSTFEVPFLSTGDISCLVRSSSISMFGGDLPHSEILKRVDAYVKNSRAQIKKNDDARVSPSSDETYPDPAACDSSAKTLQTNHCDAMSSPAFDNIASDAAAQTCLREEASAHTLGESLKDWTRFDGNNFFYAVKPQLDEMFVRYPSDEPLAAIVQNSKWVRVDAKDGTYSVGVLFDGSEPAFICYAVPELANDRRPPAEIEGMCVWLPASGAPQKGYWVIYQSAKTGEIIK